MAFASFLAGKHVKNPWKKPPVPTFLPGCRRCPGSPLQGEARSNTSGVAELGFEELQVATGFTLLLGGSSHLVSGL